MSLVVPSLRGIVASAPWAKNELWRKAQAVPSLDLRFADSKSLTDAVSGQSLITFTRASSGTYIGSDGLIKTALADVPRFDHDPETGESLGLLVEEQRTNLLLGSDTLATQSVTVTAAAHTLSFYGTGTVTLSGAHSATVVGTGAYPIRTTITFTPTAGSLTVAVSGTVQYAQLEAGAFPTSYIKNVDTPGGVTLSADVASITGANFSSWYRQDEGTYFVGLLNAPPLELGSFPQIFQASAGGSNNDRIALLRYANGAIRTNVVTAGATQAAFNLSPTIPNGDAGSIAYAYAANDIAASVNGGTVGTDTVATLPVLDALIIGSAVTGTAYFNGTIGRLTFFNRRLPDATLQAITSP
jgi:hypothetical protein